MLKFIRQNLFSKCSKELKSTLLTLVWSPNFRIFFTCVGPLYSYTLLTYWYPIHWKSPKMYSPSSGCHLIIVGSMLNELQWSTLSLSSDQIFARMSTFYKIIHQSMLSLVHYFIPINKLTNHHHSLNYTTLSTHQ